MELSGCDTFVDRPEATPGTQGCEQALSPCPPRANRFTEPSKLSKLSDVYSVYKEHLAVANTLVAMPRPEERSQVQCMTRLRHETVEDNDIVYCSTRITCKNGVKYDNLRRKSATRTAYAVGVRTLVYLSTPSRPVNTRETSLPLTQAGARICVVEYAVYSSVLETPKGQYRPQCLCWYERVEAFGSVVERALYAPK